MTANTRKPIRKLIKTIFTFLIITSMLINTTFTTQAADKNKKPVKPAKTAITSITRNASGKSITVKFKKIKKATGYQVAYKTGSDKKYIIKKTKKTTYTIKTKKNKIYNIKVRAYTTKNKKTIYGKWSKTKTVNTAKNTCQHNWITITDSEAWDEPIYEEREIYEHIYRSNIGKI